MAYRDNGMLHPGVHDDVLFVVFAPCCHQLVGEHSLGKHGDGDDGGHRSS